MQGTMDRLAQLKKLYEVDDTDAFLTYGIALEYAKRDELEEAILWLDITLGLSPQDSYAYFQKGKILGELGQFSEACQTLQTGIKVAEAGGDTKASRELRELMQSMQES